MQRPDRSVPKRVSEFSVGQWLLAAAVLAFTLGGCGGRSDSSDATGLRATVLVEPFRTGDSVPPSWSAGAFADSLAVALSRVQGLAAQSSSEQARVRTDFTLNGDVDVRDGRLVIATRLRRAGEDTDLWTSTYWRESELTSRLVAFLTVPITEAVFRDLARRAAASSKEER
jgi:hypothetical protein